jgi:hypothetical protein
VEGYKRLMEQNLEWSVAAWKSVRDSALNPLITEYHSRVFKHHSVPVQLEKEDLVDVKGGSEFAWASGTR